MASWYAAFFAWNPSSRSSFHQHSTSSTWQKPIWWRPSLAGQHTLSGKLSGFWQGSNHRHLWLLGSFGILHRLSTFPFCRFLLFFWMVFFSPPASKKAFMSTSYFAWASWNFFWYTAFSLFTQSWKHFSPANLVMAVTRWPCWLLGLGQWVHLFEEEHEAKLSGAKETAETAVKASMQEIVKQLQESFFLHLIPWNMYQHSLKRPTPASHLAIFIVWTPMALTLIQVTEAFAMQASTQIQIDSESFTRLLNPTLPCEHAPWMVMVRVKNWNPSHPLKKKHLQNYL